MAPNFHTRYRESARTQGRAPNLLGRLAVSLGFVQYLNAAAIASVGQIAALVEEKRSVVSDL